MARRPTQGSQHRGDLKAIGGSMCDAWNNLIATQMILSRTTAAVPLGSLYMASAPQCPKQSDHAIAVGAELGNGRGRSAQVENS
jgi:hypothetical protein